MNALKNSSIRTTLLCTRNWLAVHAIVESLPKRTTIARFARNAVGFVEDSIKNTASIVLLPPAIVVITAARVCQAAGEVVNDYTERGWGFVHGEFSEFAAVRSNQQYEAAVAVEAAAKATAAEAAAVEAALPTVAVSELDLAASAPLPTAVEPALVASNGQAVDGEDVYLAD
jgi:hypothetical protein